ncbi:MAG: SMP-30/gluconolactonase/LRE family protein, partial [Granulosicoccaceae bacterium]
MIDLNSVSRLGSGLHRPECVLSTQNGRLYTADWRGGVGVMEANGEQWALLPKDASLELKPNGICLMPDGSVLMAHLGSEDGGVYRISEAGDVSAFCLEVEGEALPPSNYVHLDSVGRVWITVSTRQIPRSKGYHPDVADGFVVLVDRRGARIVADTLGYTNECLVDPSGQFLYVNETFGRKLVRYAITEAGELRNKHTVTEFGLGIFPDGMTFDSEGGIWITSIVSNRVIRVAPDGSQH